MGNGTEYRLEIARLGSLPFLFQRVCRRILACINSTIKGKDILRMRTWPDMFRC